MSVKTVYPLARMRKAGLGAAMKAAIKKNYDYMRGKCPRCSKRALVKESPIILEVGDKKRKALAGFTPVRHARHCLNCGLCFSFKRGKTAWGTPKSGRKRFTEIGRILDVSGMDICG